MRYTFWDVLVMQGLDRSMQLLVAPSTEVLPKSSMMNLGLSEVSPIETWLPVW